MKRTGTLVGTLGALALLAGTTLAAEEEVPLLPPPPPIDAQALESIPTGEAILARDQAPTEVEEEAPAQGPLYRLEPDLTDTLAEARALQLEVRRRIEQADFEESESALRALEDLLGGSTPVTIRLRAEHLLAAGDSLGAASAYTLWLERIGAHGMRDPLEARAAEQRESFLDELGPRMASRRRDSANDLLRAGEYNAALELLEQTSELGLRDWSEDLALASRLVAARALADDALDDARRTLDRTRPHLSSADRAPLERDLRLRSAQAAAASGEWVEAYELLEASGASPVEGDAMRAVWQQALNARFVQHALEGRWDACRALAEEARHKGLELDPAFRLALLLRMDDGAENVEAQLDALLEAKGPALAGITGVEIPQTRATVRQLSGYWEQMKLELGDAGERIAQSTRELNTLRAEVSGAEDQLGALDRQIDGLQDDVAAARRRDAQAIERRAMLERQISGLTSRQQQLERQQRDAQRIGAAREAAAAMQQSGQTSQSAQRNIAAANAMAGMVEADLRSTAPELERINEELRELRAELRQTESANNEAEAAARLRSAEERRDALRRENAARRERISSLEAEIREARSAYAASERRWQESFREAATGFDRAAAEEARDAGVLEPIAPRWDDAPKAYANLAALRERGLAEDVEFVIPPPRFTLEPDLDFAGGWR